MFWNINGSQATNKAAENSKNSKTIGNKGPGCLSTENGVPQDTILGPLFDFIALSLYTCVYDTQIIYKVD